MEVDKLAEEVAVVDMEVVKGDDDYCDTFNIKESFFFDSSTLTFFCMFYFH